ncbi:hypothetical protein [Paenibacillus polymyxa]|uniref:hypothetical protein n=1 Tax=Paenibacillus polymyxa TaxID=1406 RepID=UPI002AB33AF2|nr:hypothetical protein [Paenibacillus polymyxa]MDY8021176.1 hypothetical protein [Paenibacillus polymyxa]
MVEKLIIDYKIKNKAVNLLDAIYFLITSDADIEDFRYNCSDGGIQEINRYLIKKRKEKLEKNKYKNIEEFIDNYKINNLTALERLCQERIGINKLSKLKSSDPSRIYAIHNERGPYVRFMELALYV